MSTNNPYANGYGYSDRYDGGNNNSNGGVNGYGGGATGEESRRNGSREERPRDRRQGGWGGFYGDGDNSSRSQSQSQSREREQERQPSTDQGDPRGRNRPNWERPSESSASRSRPRDVNTGTRWRPGRDDTDYLRQRNRSDASGNQRTGANGLRGTQSVEELLRTIQRDWDFMSTDDCIPVQVALQLMDNSTLGKADREPDFQDTHKQIHKTLRSVVNEHHQGFNSSIGTYHKIQSSIHSSQGRVRTLRHSLEDAKSGLLTTKPELKGLATSSQNYDDILQLFNQIQEIQSLPEKLEAKISEKRFLGAVNILHDAFRLMRRSEFESIGALMDIRAYFENQETSLTEILVEELHDHLYLKSAYCQDRWKSQVTEDQSSVNGTAGGTTWDRPVYSFLAKLDSSSPMVEDSSKNPEADTFSYIRLLLETLSKMGHLEVAVDRIEQRLPVELFAVVDKTNSEVDARHPDVSRGFASKDSGSGLPTDINEKRGHVLSEFLWTLYAKFEAIAEGHRVVHDVIAGILDREGGRRSTLTGGFKELWKLYQSEIRSLLHDYLATDGDMSLRPSGRETDAQRSLSLNQRDRTRKIFKLSEIDQKSDMKAEQEELDEILRASVPGLVSKSVQKTATGETLQSAKGHSGTGHKLLVKPSVFNMGLLLPPSLSFISRLKDIVPTDSEIIMSTLTSFLDDFLINVFQPQLDEAVTDLCTLTFISSDAFAEDPNWASVSPKPIFKGTVSFMALVKAFSKMLDSIPHDQNFTQLVLSQIVTYYDKCCGWYKALVTRVSMQQSSGLRLKTAATLAESGEIHDTLMKLLNEEGNSLDLIDKETEALINQTTDTPLESYDIISDPKTVASLALLNNSMQWLASNLERLRRVTTVSTDGTQSGSMRLAQGRRWTLITAMRPKRDSASNPVHLPMNQESATIFDNTLRSLRGLAATALLTLHVDIRCGVIYSISRVMAGGPPTPPKDGAPTTPLQGANMSWPLILSNQPTAAAPAILELNNDLMAFDTNLATYLGPSERQFITTGLERFIDQVFVSCTRYIGAMNHNGALRLQLDVLVLQQNLKNIILGSADASETHQKQTNQQVSLPRSAKFLDWFIEGPQKALDYAKEEKEAFMADREKALAAGNGEPFTYDELRVLIELCFSEIMRGPRGQQSREDFMAAKRNNGDAMLRLSEVMWDAK